MEMLPEPTEANCTLTDEKVRAEVVALVARHLALETQGRLVNPTMVADVLVYAAVTGKSLHGACDELLDCADGNTIREHLTDYFDGHAIDWLEEIVNRMLIENVPRKVRRGKWDLAIDLHDQPCYGKSAELCEAVCRGEAHAGTTRFFRIATSYVVAAGIRLTLAVRFVRPTDGLASVVERLLDRTRPHMGTVRCLFMDKGFASVDVYNRLDRLGISAIIACPTRGKSGGTGTRTLTGRWCNRTTTHTFVNPEHGAKTVRMAVVYVYHPERKEGRRQQWLLYVQLHNKWSPKRVCAEYRHRFGIESSYRALNQVRAHTTSRIPAFRFLILGLALVLQNLWSSLRFLYCQRPKQGRAGRPIDEDRFRLHRFRDFIRHAIERGRRLISSIASSVTPRHGLAVNY